MKYSGLCLGGPLDGMKLENNKPMYDAVVTESCSTTEYGRLALVNDFYKPTPAPKKTKYLFRETDDGFGVWVLSDDKPYNVLCKLHKHYSNAPVALKGDEVKTLVFEILRDIIPPTELSNNDALERLTKQIIEQLDDNDLTIAAVKK